jgi:DNA-binding XRE family transcriptional regulator
MILNDRQYTVTNAQIARLKAALAASRDRKGKMDSQVYQSMLAGIESQIDELQKDLLQYEKLKTITKFHLTSPKEFGITLIKCRIALGLTQKDLADRMKLKPQQIQKYEETFYASASLKRIIDVTDALGMEIDAELSLPSKAMARVQVL